MSARALGLLAVALAAPLAAQSDGRLIRGSVTDSSGRPVPYANIQTKGVDRYVADSAGRFAFRTGERGALAYRVFRIGYEPKLMELASGGDTSIAIALNRITYTLEKIEVHGSRVSKRLDAQGFYGRLNDRKKGLGSATFITEDDIEQRRPLRMTHMLQSIPGVRVVSGGGSQMEGELRGLNGCDFTIYVDGTRAYPKTAKAGMSRPDRSLDGLMAQTSRKAAAAAASAKKPSDAGQQIDAIMTPSATAGVEVYPRGAGAPARFPMANSTCGVAVFWSK